MNKNQSKRVGTVFIVLILLGLIYFGWVLFRSDQNTTNGNLSTQTPAKSPATTSSDTTSDSDKDTANTTTPSIDLATFSKTGFNFTFKYPKSWKIDSATATAMAENPNIKQQTVKIITDAGIEYHLDNPATEANFDGYDLKNDKNVTAGTLIFKRVYGLNSSNGQTLYLADYTDPNNLDAASISLYGASAKLDTTTISNLDQIVSSFKFTQ